ncbi:hypothetical protein BDK51DRAFT_52225 [Blyttiomyces helicus]|uniref:Uncharacterized protein n=1 Tax=Blyttiomyces helicus TaxID=388810 RepID=A0A4P9W343_9FUNG|nr:hypothetical protein BDK51DRAFT_52225 [Blyttiomyces helicus]|eukprot:RKO86709.1 hypothetical protein BDK51DRAFT_52225 [Blyttiomyces helicus]
MPATTSDTKKLEKYGKEKADNRKNFMVPPPWVCGSFLPGRGPGTVEYCWYQSPQHSLKGLCLLGWPNRTCPGPTNSATNSTEQQAVSTMLGRTLNVILQLAPVDYGRQDGRKVRSRTFYPSSLPFYIQKNHASFAIAHIKKVAVSMDEYISYYKNILRRHPVLGSHIITAITTFDGAFLSFRPLLTNRAIRSQHGEMIQDQESFPWLACNSLVTALSTYFWSTSLLTSNRTYTSFSTGGAHEHLQPAFVPWPH